MSGEVQVDEREPGGRADPTSGRRLGQDIVVEGVLRLGDDCICNGDIIAPGGVILGDRVVVEGDVFTDGPVQMGTSCQIAGEIVPTASHPRGDTGRKAPGQQWARPQRAPTPEPGQTDTNDKPGSTPPGERPTVTEAPTEIKINALRSTLEVLFELALDASHRSPSDELDWGLSPDALDDLLAGIHALAADLHRDGDDRSPWTPEETFEILLGKVVPLAVRVSVDRYERGRARLRIRRPDALLDRDPPGGWAVPVISVIEALGRTVHPSFEIESLDDALVGPATGPDEIIVLVSTKT